MLDMISHNLLSPAVLFFTLGLLAAIVKSDLKYPQALTDTLSIYLLIAIGLKGGIELSHYELSQLLSPIAGTLLLGLLIPFLTYMVCRGLRIDRVNAIALAATYGSVSIVTFGAATAYLDYAGLAHESYMTAMVVLLESPAIFLAMLLYRLTEKTPNATLSSKSSSPSELSVYTQVFDKVKTSLSGAVLRESLFGKSILLMAGGLLIGWILGEKAIPIVKPLFIDLYGSILTIFLLGMGLVAGERIAAFKAYGFKLIGLAIVFPFAFGCLGIVVGHLCGLNAGSTALMGVLGASSSYIAAPAALRQSIPEANPSIYLGMSLGITFPVNLVIGLPVYVKLAQWLHM
jgi:hypothetical protein